MVQYLVFLFNINLPSEIDRYFLTTIVRLHQKNRLRNNGFRSINQITHFKKSDRTEFDVMILKCFSELPLFIKKTEIEEKKTLKTHSSWTIFAALGSSASAWSMRWPYFPRHSFKNPIIVFRVAASTQFFKFLNAIKTMEFSNVRSTPLFSSKSKWKHSNTSLRASKIRTVFIFSTIIGRYLAIEIDLLLAVSNYTL